jgi:NADPH-dependent ferric siderophore reductase
MTPRTPPRFTGPNRTGRTQVDFIPELGRRLARVISAENVTPRYRRIVLGGDDFASGFPYLHFAPSDHVKCFFPDPETGELAFPVVTDKGWEMPEGSGDPINRDYTVRAWDPGTKQLTLDFVVHEHGVAGLWARDAKPGDEIGVLGPRGHIVFPEDPARIVAAGDETALPAIARVIEEAPASARVTALIEVADDGERQDLSGAANVEIQWVPRSTAPVGEGHGSALETAVRALGLMAEESLFVFVAGETHALKPIRRYLRRELGLSKEQIDVDGYWKRGTVNLDHHAGELDEDD